MRSLITYVLLLCGMNTFIFSQEQNSFSGTILNVLSSLDSIVSTEYQEMEEPDFVTVIFPGTTNRDGSIQEIVKTYYSSASREINPVDVLGFLTNAYSEHDFHESGNWTKESSYNTTYIPYKGVLPDYTLKDFCLPISGKLTSVFGYRPKRHRNHNGIDVAANIGDSVKCVLPGVVTKIGYERAGYGHYVVVAHSGDIETIYAHLDSTKAYPGQKMKTGDLIGLAGSTGNSTGPHLHFETRYRGLPVNPYSWFNLSELK